MVPKGFFSYRFFIASHLLLLVVITMVSCKTFATVKGVFVTSNPMKIVHGVSVISCTQKCAFHNTCKGVNYNKEKHECKLFSNIGNTSKTSEWDLYLKDGKDKTKVSGCEERFYVSQPHYPFCTQCDVHWELLKERVCFGGADDNFAAVPINQSMHVCGIRYKYISGFIGDHENATKSTKYYWILEGAPLNILPYIIKNKNRKIIFPKNKRLNPKMLYYLNNVIYSDTLEFSSYLEPVALDTEIQLWYGEDLVKNDVPNDENHGELCVDVSAGVI